MGGFVTAFARFGVAITVGEAHGPMRMAKRVHVKSLLQAPRTAAA